MPSVLIRHDVLRSRSCLTALDTMRMAPPAGASPDFVKRPCIASPSGAWVVDVSPLAREREREWWVLLVGGG